MHHAFFRSATLLLLSLAIVAAIVPGCDGWSLFNHSNTSSASLSSSRSGSSTPSRTRASTPTATSSRSFSPSSTVTPAPTSSDSFSPTSPSLTTSVSKSFSTSQSIGTKSTSASESRSPSRSLSASLSSSPSTSLSQSNTVSTSMSTSTSPTITQSDSASVSVSLTTSMSGSVSVTSTSSNSLSLTTTATSSKTPTLTSSVTTSATVSESRSESISSSISSSLSATTSISMTQTASWTSTLTQSVSATTTVTRSRSKSGGTASFTSSMTETVSPPPTTTPSLTYTTSMTATITPPPTPTITTTLSISMSGTVTPPPTPTVSITLSTTASVTLTTSGTGSMSWSTSSSPTATMTVSMSSTLPETMSLTFSESIRWKWMWRCPEVTISSHPSPLTEHDIRTKDNVTIYAQVPAPWKWWDWALEPEHDRLQLKSVGPAGAAQGFFGFQQLLEKMLITENNHRHIWWFSHDDPNGTTVRLVLPKTPQYDLALDETIELVVSPSAQAFRGGCRYPDTVVSNRLTIKADEEPPLLTIVSGFVAGATLVASITGAGAAAASVQTLAVLSAMSCSRPYERESSAVLMNLLLPFYTPDDGPVDAEDGVDYEDERINKAAAKWWVAMLGNIGLCLVVVVLHATIAGCFAIYHRRRTLATFWVSAKSDAPPPLRTSFEAGCAAALFPNLSLIVASYLYLGTAFSGWMLLTDTEYSDRKTTVGLGILGLCWSLAVPIAMFLVRTKAAHASFSKYTIFSEMDIKLRRFVPVGFWETTMQRRMFSSAFMSMVPERSQWSIYHFVMLWLLSLVASFRPSGNYGHCATQYFAIAAIIAATGLIVLACWPHRNKATNVLAPLQLLSLAIVVLLKALETRDPGNTHIVDGLKGAVIMQLLLCLLRSVHEGVVFVMEYQRWIPAQQCVIAAKEEELLQIKEKPAPIQVATMAGGATQEHSREPALTEPVAATGDPFVDVLFHFEATPHQQPGITHQDHGITRGFIENREVDHQTFDMVHAQLAREGGGANRSVFPREERPATGRKPRQRYIPPTPPALTSDNLQPPESTSAAATNEARTLQDELLEAYL